jgi:cytochrome P450
MSVETPAPLTTNPAIRIGRDVWDELHADGRFPPGDTRFSLKRTGDFISEPLPLLLEAYERYGPIFSLRILQQRFIFMLGPEANHHILVSHAKNFHWREGFGDLIPLLGDGLLTIDGGYHRRARRIMLPAFHRDSIAASADSMVQEAGRAIATWRPDEVVDMYHWTRELAMRIAMRSLLGLDPDRGGGASGARAAEHFERALSYYGRGIRGRLQRGPGSPWRDMHASRRVLDEILYEEIRRRRATGESSPDDILGMLIAATDEDGSQLSEREIRDQAMTLMFAGHDTTTSTVTFMLHELARHPIELDRVIAEVDEVLAGEPPRAEHLGGGALPRLQMALDETLRLYPPAWIGPRRNLDAFDFAGSHVPANSYVYYSSWASHRIPSVFGDPEAFIPDRFAPEAKAALAKGAYVPFGGGSRTCIGMRFGEMEIRAIVAMALQRFRPEAMPGRTMVVRQTPTLGPKGGLELRMRPRRGG